ncbi:MAG: hypothetical protein RLZZ450_5015 [Pseudomonadota bacterium]|jgi:hypothetical protein
MLLGMAALAVVTGCGTVRLGDEAPWIEPAVPFDAAVIASRADIDAGVPITGPVAVVTIHWPEGCDDCADVLVQGAGGAAPYTVEWADGLRTAERRICPDVMARTLAVAVTDATGVRSVPHVTKLLPVDASCPADPPAPDWKPLCLLNPSFEGTPAFNSGLPTVFDAAPWSVCTNPSRGNTPEIASDGSAQGFATNVPKATAGETWLGLADGEQASQPLCRGVAAGSQHSFQIDLRRLYLAGVTPDNEPSYLEIWGGIGATCTANERLWASPKLDTTWNTYCVTLEPRDYFDNLVLLAKSDPSTNATTYLIVDNIVTVESCF